jgi:type II secretory pathway pseudopilin PulG
MVEMLGVLAIIGVLFVGGVYGYGVAMKKHKANELLHQASMLATTVSAQIMSGKDPTELDTFADSNLGKFTLDYDSTKTTFDLKISELDGSVCSQLKKGGMVQNVDCNPDAKTATLTYYKNLATNDEEGKKSPTGGSGSTKGNPGPAGDEDGAECS